MRPSTIPTTIPSSIIEKTGNVKIVVRPKNAAPVMSPMAHSPSEFRRVARITKNAARHCRVPGDIYRGIRPPSGGLSAIP